MKKQSDSGFLNVGEVSIHFNRWPARNAQNVIFLHGMSSRSDTWEQVINELDEIFDITAIDLRGHGRSGHLAGYYKLEDYAKDIIDVIEKIEIAPVIVVGHSLGAMVAMEAFSRNQSLFRGQILEDPPIFGKEVMQSIDPDRFDGFVRLRDLVSRAFSKQRIEEVLSKQNPSFSYDQIKSMSDSVFPLDTDVLNHLIDKRLDWSDRFQVPACMSGTNTLILYGEFNIGGWLNENHVLRVKSLIHSSNFELWDGSGHSLHRDDPIRFANRLKQFVSDLE